MGSRSGGRNASRAKPNLMNRPPPFSRYGLSNCLFASTYDQILEQCACVPFFHTLAYMDYPVVCSGSSLLCMNNILRDIGSHTHAKDINGVKKHCYSPCTDQERRSWRPANKKDSS